MPEKKMMHLIYCVDGITVTITMEDSKASVKKIRNKRWPLGIFGEPIMTSGKHVEEVVAGILAASKDPMEKAK